MWMLLMHRHFVSELNFVLGNVIFIVGCGIGIVDPNDLNEASGNPLAIDLFLAGSIFFFIGSIVAFVKPSKLEYGRMSYLEQVTADDEEEASSSGLLADSSSYQQQGAAADC